MNRIGSAAGGFAKFRGCSSSTFAGVIVGIVLILVVACVADDLGSRLGREALFVSSLGVSLMALDCSLPVLAIGCLSQVFAFLRIPARGAALLSGDFGFESMDLSFLTGSFAEELATFWEVLMATFSSRGCSGLGTSLEEWCESPLENEFSSWENKQVAIEQSGALGQGIPLNSPRVENILMPW